MATINKLAAGRRRARHFALQALYQWTLNRADISGIEAEFRVDNDFTHVDTEYFHELVSGVAGQVSVLDSAYETFLDIPLKDLDPIERNLLRLACFELIHRIDVPYRVVINEAVALAKKFGATDSFRFINGVLDKVARAHRELEVAAEQ
jgi:N utilization substance protein B